MTVWKFAPRWLLQIIILIAVVSFAASVWETSHDAQSAFYLLPTRAWELLIGSILAITSLPRIHNNGINWVLSFIGITCVVAPMFLYSDTTPFPGLAALPPCLGAAILIYSGSTHSKYFNKLLSISPLRVIGLMSYSLYLWHWPILAFERYCFQSNLSITHRFAAIAGSFILAYLSWQYIEIPFRKRMAPFRLKTILSICLATFLIVIVASYWIIALRGAPNRFLPEVLQYATTKRVDSSPWRSRGIHNFQDVVTPMGASNSEGTDRPDFLLWGDSHAMVVSRACDTIAEEKGLSGFAALQSGAIPIPGIARVSKADAIEWNDTVFKWLQDRKPKTVILCARWSVNIDGRPSGKLDSLVTAASQQHVSIEDARKQFQQGLQLLVDQCELLDIHVYFFMEVPYQSHTPAQRALATIITNVIPDSRGINAATHAQHQQSVRTITSSIAGSNISIVRLDLRCFDESQLTIVSDVWTSYYYDDDHLNGTGVQRLLLGTLEAVFDEIARQP